MVDQLARDVHIHPPLTSIGRKGHIGVHRNITGKAYKKHPVILTGSIAKLLVCVKKDMGITVLDQFHF